MHVFLIVENVGEGNIESLAIFPDCCMRLTTLICHYLFVVQDKITSVIHRNKHLVVDLNKERKLASYKNYR